MENSILELISLVASVITLFWAMYHAHTAETYLGKIVYVIIILAFITLIVSSVVPAVSQMSAGNTSGYVWQRVFARSAIALFNIYDLKTQWGTARWKEAFVNSAKVQKVLHFPTRNSNLPNVKRG